MYDSESNYYALQQAKKTFSGYKSTHNKKVGLFRQYESVITSSIPDMMTNLENLETDVNSMRYCLTSISDTQTFDWDKAMGLGLNVEVYAKQSDYLAGNVIRKVSAAKNMLEKFDTQCRKEIRTIVKDIVSTETNMNSLIRVFGKDVGSYNKVDTGVFGKDA